MSSLGPLTALGRALYALLAFDSTLLTLATGGAHLDIPNNPEFPLVWIELQQDQDFGGFGSQPGRKNKPGIGFRMHIFQSEDGTLTVAQQIGDRLIALLWNDSAPLVAEGYDVMRGKPMPMARTFQFADQELRGFKVKESVLMGDYFLEATS